MKEYKAIVYREGVLGSLLLGASRINPMRLTEFLNSNAEDGWRVVTMEKDVQRMLLFFRREAYVILLERERDTAPTTNQGDA